MKNIKPCRQCGQESEHYASIVTCCKTCWRARVTARRNRLVDQIRRYDRERGKLPHRKAMYLEKTKRRRMADKRFDKAHNATHRAVAAGSLVRPLRCSRCKNKGDIEAHHDDYSKPLDVMWLCPVCHARRHKELGRLRTVDVHLESP